MNTIDELIVYSVTDAAIAKMQTEYGVLKVNGINDKEGYELCNRARINVKSLRVDVEKKRKELKADSLSFGRKVDAEASRISSQLEAIEAHLKCQQDIVDNEKLRIKQEAEAKEKQEFDRRINLLQSVKAVFSLDAVKAMTLEDFEMLYEGALAAHEHDEEERIRNEEKLRALEAQAAENAAKIRAQEEENRKLQADLIAKQKAEIAEKEAQIEKERKAREEEDRKRQEAEKARIAKENAAKAAEEKKRADEERARVEAENKRVAQERFEKEKVEQARIAAEKEAAKKIDDERFFNLIKEKFPTVELAWVEIARLIIIVRAK